MTIGLSRNEAATFAETGALRIHALGATELRELEAAIADLPPDHAGIRIHGHAAVRRWLTPPGAIWKFAATVLGETCHPVRAILFDKTVSINWALAWHQDRTIAVTERIEVAGFGPWTVKSGLLHVAPPFDVLEGMVTLRVHLDAVPATNAPLLIAPGSHRLGLILEPDIKRVVACCGSAICLAEAGDIWLYSTPILHASEAAVDPAHRRVLQVDFTVGDLPGGLSWLGV
jgi:ectoine hydroxylase-related dioxygenase (phytanoyl-CoA dioxygenase family)